jgi:hypothetical protein
MSSSIVSLDTVQSRQAAAQPETVNYLGVVVAAVAAFVASGLWYSPLLLGTQYVLLRGADAGSMTPGEIVVELLRTLVVAYVFTRLMAQLGAREWKRALRLAAWVWIGFPTMILLGSVAHENVPLQLAAIHAGDWLVKLLILAVVPSVLRRTR